MLIWEKIKSLKPVASVSTVKTWTVERDKKKKERERKVSIGKQVMKIRMNSIKF